METSWLAADHPLGIPATLDLSQSGASYADGPAQRASATALNPERPEQDSNLSEPGGRAVSQGEPARGRTPRAGFEPQRARRASGVAGASLRGAGRPEQDSNLSEPGGRAVSQGRACEGPDAPSRIRTCDLLLRRESLYPAELSGPEASLRARKPCLRRRRAGARPSHHAACVSGRVSGQMGERKHNPLINSAAGARAAYCESVHPFDYLLHDLEEGTPHRGEDQGASSRLVRAGNTPGVELGS